MLILGCFDVVLGGRNFLNILRTFFRHAPRNTQCFATRPRHTLSVTYTPVIFQRESQHIADFKDDSDPDRSCVR